MISLLLTLKNKLKIITLVNWKNFSIFCYFSQYFNIYLLFSIHIYIIDAFGYFKKLWVKIFLQFVHACRSLFYYFSSPQTKKR